jgi:hypothetical protein
MKLELADSVWKLGAVLVEWWGAVWALVEERGGVGVGTGDTVPIKYTSIQLISMMDKNPINQS